MDGVLIDAKEWHYEALNQALKLFGIPISRNDHESIFDGLPTKKKLEILANDNHFLSQLHSFINELKQQYTMDIVYARCRPQFIHEHALLNLKKLDFKLAVCSNSIKNTVEIMMEKSNLINYLDLLLSSDDVLNPKPSPDIYIAAMNYFDLPPSQCLIVEDNENGIKAALDSGAHLLVVNDVKDVNFANIYKKILEINSMAT